MDIDSSWRCLSPGLTLNNFLKDPLEKENKKNKKPNLLYHFIKIFTNLKEKRFKMNKPKQNLQVGKNNCHFCLNRFWEPEVGWGLHRQSLIQKYFLFLSLIQGIAVLFVEFVWSMAIGHGRYQHIKILFRRDNFSAISHLILPTL